ncbi:hypothetical protein B9Z39_03480 [Limnohabitans sp. JirII-29]|uniref:hypothetical protein n=1 Tax=unclassified Limnohabitans TaxID=2626134 RepID=UPI000C1E1999|nr:MULTISPECIES: hypothetical protein [unclassified Limnohabitans]PIT72598.1 hypothetical protein B9Z41_15945 [Limnohabitans sp. JirII-31]PUE29147.1 hypothetical protein B9Z39_03480 [Limnohabitans sp. JirII-29]
MQQPRWRQLPSSSHTVALASLVAFGTQVVFALLMLRLFTPQEVGEFSLLSQIGFFWMTLALAQAPLSLLANAHAPANDALRSAWRSSLQRGLWLLPLAAAAVWLSGLNAGSALLWVLLLAVCQMAWVLAQSFTLRVGTRWQQATVRVVPPLTAALTALGGAWMAWSGPTLVWSAVLGYAVGAAWLAPAWQATPDAHAQHLPHMPINPAPVHTQSDPRSARLRFAHTLSDALLATCLVVVWQRLYGAQDTGWLTALLRVLGFVPALVHMAWAQVVLAQGHAPQHLHPRRTAGLLGLVAAACVVGLGWVCTLALEWHWLDTRWTGIWIYIVPVAGWQVGACLLAAFSHRPFQTHAAVRYSWACIALTCVQAVVLWGPVLASSTPDAAQHIVTFASVSGLGLLALTVWVARLR